MDRNRQRRQGDEPRKLLLSDLELPQSPAPAASPGPPVGAVASPKTVESLQSGLVDGRSSPSIFARFALSSPKILRGVPTPPRLSASSRRSTTSSGTSGSDEGDDRLLGNQSDDDDDAAGVVSLALDSVLASAEEDPVAASAAGVALPSPARCAAAAPPVASSASSAASSLQASPPSLDAQVAAHVDSPGQCSDGPGLLVSPGHAASGNVSTELPALQSSSATAAASAQAADLAKRSRDLVWPTRASEYELEFLIGRRENVSVWKARWVAGDMECAIKITDLEDETPDNFLRHRHEIQAMAMCRHDNIIRYYSSFVHEHCLWLVTSVHNGGSLADILALEFRDGIADEVVLATILKGVVSALAYLHTSGRVHSDVRGHTVLLSGSGVPVLASLHMCTWLQASGEVMSSTTRFVGTLPFMAPEVLEQNYGYDTKADIWSFGMMALELVCGAAPFADFPPTKIFLDVLQHPPPTLADLGKAEAFSSSFSDMIDQCLQKDPASRPTATKLLEHRFFKLAKKQHDIVADRVVRRLPSFETRLRRLDQIAVDMGRPRRLPPPPTPYSARTPDPGTPPGIGTAVPLRDGSSSATSTCSSTSSFVTPVPLIPAQHAAAAAAAAAAASSSVAVTRQQAAAMCGTSSSATAFPANPMSSLSSSS